MKKVITWPHFLHTKMPPNHTFHLRITCFACRVCFLVFSLFSVIVMAIKFRNEIVYLTVLTIFRRCGYFYSLIRIFPRHSNTRCKTLATPCSSHFQCCMILNPDAGVNENGHEAATFGSLLSLFYLPIVCNKLSIKWMCVKRDFCYSAARPEIDLLKKMCAIRKGFMHKISFVYLLG